MVSTHAVRGEVKVYPECDSARMFASLKRLFYDSGGKNEVALEAMRASGKMVLLKIKQVDSPEQARGLIGKPLFFDRDDVKLEKGRYYIDDLIGCAVVDADSKKVYGEVSQVSFNGKHDVYHVSAASGITRYIPAAADFIASVDTKLKIIQVRPIPGMLED